MDSNQYLVICKVYHYQEEGSAGREERKLLQDALSSSSGTRGSREIRTIKTLFIPLFQISLANGDKYVLLDHDQV